MKVTLEWMAVPPGSGKGREEPSSEPLEAVWP
jgi:hypothetical protein